MSEVRVNNLSNESLSGGPTISGITTFSSPYFFVPPQGDTASRPQSCPSGSLRFNTDSAKLEYYRGDTIGWVEVEASQNNSGLPEARGNYVGFLAGGNDPNPWTGKNSIDYVTITTFGNSLEFGDMQTDKTGHQAICNDIRIIFPGGYRGNGYQNSITFNNVQSKGNGFDFGDLIGVKLRTGTVNNKTRGIIGSGQNSNGSPYNTNVIEYVNIATQSDSIDFGDNTSLVPSNGCSSSTRGLFAQDSNSPAEVVYITHSTLGNTQDFGNITGHRSGGAGASSATRCIWSGNYFGNNISYMTMATLGDSIDFGDLDVSRDDPRGMSSPTRAVIACGRHIPAYRGINTMSTIQIATTGNAVFFGDITYMGDQDDNTSNIFGGSNGHGGLSG